MFYVTIRIRTAHTSSTIQAVTRGQAIAQLSAAMKANPYIHEAELFQRGEFVGYVTRTDLAL